MSSSTHSDRMRFPEARISLFLTWEGYDDCVNSTTHSPSATESSEPHERKKHVWVQGPGFRVRHATDVSLWEIHIPSALATGPVAAVGIRQDTPRVVGELGDCFLAARARGIAESGLITVNHYDVAER